MSNRTSEKIDRQLFLADQVMLIEQTIKISKGLKGDYAEEIISKLEKEKNKMVNEIKSIKY